MKRSYCLQLISLSLMLMILISPASTAAASDVSNRVFAQSAVTASAVVVPAQAAEMGFLVSGLAEEIPVNEWDEVKAGQTLMVLDTPELEFAVVANKEALRAAEAEVKIQSYKRIKVRRGGRIFFDLVSPEVRQLAAARAQQAQVALEIAQVNLAQGTLTAPYDGTVVSIKVIPGEFVAKNQAIVTLAKLDNLQIETTDLSERDVAKVNIGDSANIFIEALNENISGRVVAISPIASRAAGDVVYQVTVALDAQLEGMLWGMTAEVTIIGK